MIFEVTIPGPPRPKARPRQGRGHWYDPSAKDEEAVAWYFARHKGEFLEGDVRVDTFFYVVPRSRADEDNLRKLVLDALQRIGVVNNDRQVVGGLCWREWAVGGDGARSVVRIGRPSDPWEEHVVPDGLLDRLSPGS